MAIAGNNHPLYKDYESRWKKCRDSFEGENAIKRNGQKYLLPFSRQLLEEDYNRFIDVVKRSQYLPAYSKTVSSHVGSIFRDSPTYTVPDRVEADFENLDGRGSSFTNVTEEITEEVFKVGRVGISIDVRQGRPIWLIHTAEDILNWYENTSRIVEWVVLRMRSYVPNENDRFHLDLREFYRLLEVTNGGVRVTDSDGVENGVVYDRYPLGSVTKPLRELPFVVINVGDNSMNPSKPPEEDLADVLLSAYQTSSQLENILNLHAVAQPILKGLTDDESDPIWGAGVWKVGQEVDSSILEPVGHGIQHLANHYNQKKDQISSLGSNVFQEGLIDRETATAASIRAASTTTLLNNVCDSVERGVKRMLSIHKSLYDLDNEETNFELNRDFFGLEKFQESLSGGATQPEVNDDIEEDSNGN